MRMDERYSNAAYGSAGLVAFFASLSLQDWGFIIGVAFSIILGVLTYRLNSKRLVRTVLIFTESSDQLSRATDRVPGLPASPGYVQ
ncbi:phage holin family protein [Escherichia coli]